MILIEEIILTIEAPFELPLVRRVPEPANTKRGLAWAILPHHTIGNEAYSVVATRGFAFFTTFTCRSV